ncbi:MAG: hypothetical protein RL264_1937 [Bacteroidota bacterium]|jgi:hypothetical protein
MNDLIQIDENKTITLVGNRNITIEINQFNSVRTENEYNNCSNLFLQLSQQDNGISMELLYELARILNDILPNHQINWMSTFCVINMEVFNNILNGNGINGNIEEDEINVFDNIEDAIDINRQVNEELSNGLTRTNFEEGVRISLVREGIITE